MTPITPQQDLIVLTADKNTEWAIRGVLCRTASLSIRAVSADYYVHPEHDPGCLRKAGEFLASFVSMYEHALVVLDREGCGHELAGRTELEASIEAQLRSKGWGDRAAAIVIDPELEVWVWSTSRHVPTELGWEGTETSFWAWIKDQGYLKEDGTKPSSPKEALEKCLWKARQPRSSTLYKSLADKVSLAHCEDQSFAKLRDTLRSWFPSAASH